MSTELAERAVACTALSRASGKPKWRWMRGMSTTCGVLVFEGDADYLIGERSGPTREGGGTVDTGDTGGLLPNFDDAATRGCVPTLAREAWGDPDLYAFADHDENETTWEIRTPLRFGTAPPGRLGRCVGAAELEAWIVALECAP